MYPPYADGPTSKAPKKKSSITEELTDLQALRCVMAAIMYSEIRHERYLSHNLEEVKPEVLYAATFEAVDGLLKEGMK